MSLKMPWTSGSRGANLGGANFGPNRADSDKAEVSLDNILPTAALRVELVLLVVLCTDAMRAKVNSTFEIQQLQSVSPDAGVATQLDKNFPLLNFDNPDQLTSTAAPLGRAQTTYIHNLALSSSELQMLKASAISYFNNWRTSVLRRLGEALKVQPDAVKRAKAKYIANRVAEDKAKRYQEYLDWAEGNDSFLGSERDSAPKSTSSQRSEVFGLETFYTKLNSLDEKTRTLILNAALFILLSLERYPAHSRVLLSRITHSLDLPGDILTSAEANLALTLQHSTSSASTTPGSTTTPDRASSNSNTNSKWKIGLATIAGATLIGVTGGLAAPFLLGAAGAIMGGVGLGGLATLLGATIANPVTVAALFGVLGGRMSGRAMAEFAKEVDDFEIVPITCQTEAVMKQATRGEKTSDKDQPLQSHMRVAIGVSGHLLSRDDIARPWHIFSPTSFTSFAVRYESAALLKFGESLTGVLRDSAYTLAQAGALQVALPALSAALLPVSLLNLGSFLDNPFSIAMERSDKAGIVLAKALIARVHGERPVTLVGYSLGARVVYSCIMELAKSGGFGIVENAVLIGGPLPSDQSVWVKMRAVVSDRLVNVFSTDDLLLGYMYRVRYAQVGVAGLEAIDRVHGVESFDVTGMVKGHGQYRLATGAVLQKIGFDGLDADKVQEECIKLKNEDKEEKDVHTKAQRDGRLREQEDEGGRIVMVDLTIEQELQLRQHKREHEHEHEHEHQHKQNVSGPEIEGRTCEAKSVPKPNHTMTQGAMLDHRDVHDVREIHGDSQHQQPQLHDMQGDEDELPADSSSSEGLSRGTYPEQAVEDDEDGDELAGPQPIQMINIEPCPEPNPEGPFKSREKAQSPTPETVRFGSPARGFDVSWNGKLEIR